MKQQQEVSQTVKDQVNQLFNSQQRISIQALGADMTGIKRRLFLSFDAKNSVLDKELFVVKDVYLSDQCANIIMEITGRATATQYDRPESSIEIRKFVNECYDMMCKLVKTIVLKHMHGMWEGMSAEDKTFNSQAIEDGSRIIGTFSVPINDKDVVNFWAITESDREDTTILLPSEVL